MTQNRDTSARACAVAILQAVAKTPARVLTFLLDDAEFRMVQQIAKANNTLPAKVVMEMVRQTRVPTSPQLKSPYRRPQAPIGQQRKNVLKIWVLEEDAAHMDRLVAASGGNRNLTISRLIGEVASGKRRITFNQPSAPGRK